MKRKAIPDDKFWGQYGPGVRRLKGGAPLVDKPVFTFTELDVPWSKVEPMDNERYIWSLVFGVPEYYSYYLDWCVKQCWRD